jgi:hypothetical protein
LNTELAISMAAARKAGLVSSARQATCTGVREYRPVDGSYWQ